MQRIFSQPQSAFQKTIIDGLVKQNVLYNQTLLTDVYHSSLEDHVVKTQYVDNIYGRKKG